MSIGIPLTTTNFNPRAREERDPNGGRKPRKKLVNFNPRAREERDGLVKFGKSLEQLFQSTRS